MVVRLQVRRAGCILLAAFALAAISGVTHAQVTAKTLIGKAVSDDSDYKEINNAIARFSDRDIDGCRAIL